MPNPSDHLQELHAAKVFIDVPVAWGEMDALGHVNNVVYYRYLESSRVEYLRRVGHGRLRNDGTSVPGAAGFILQSAQCRFRVPLEYPDTVRVTARAIRLDDDRFTLTHAVVSLSRNAVAALGESVIVTYDYSEKRKMQMPDELRAAILSLDAVRQA
jgi:acyl-CoA thioester hydrolase